MPHDLTTANRHDHTRTKNWAQNICTSEHANVLPMELKYKGRQHERRDCLYTTKVKWKIYQTCCTLLDVGFVFILRRTDIFTLIWACTAVLPNLTTVIFQIIQALKQNYCVVLAVSAMLSLNGAALWLLLPHMLALLRVVIERCSETLPVTLLGISYPGPKTCNDDPL